MPRRQVRTTPRKSPNQARSKATVEAILEATARILVKEGYERTTTNRVAEAAGVSVGSLYQYFPSKEALVAALIDRHNESLLAVIGTQLAGNAALPLEQAAASIVRAMLDAHRVAPALHKVLIEQVPRVGRLKRLRELDGELERMIRVALELRCHELRVMNLDVISFVLVHSVKALTHAAVIERPELLSNPELEREITRLVLRTVLP